MNTSSEHADQRNYPRIQKEVPIEISALSHQPQEKPEFKSASKNISGGGVCFATSSPLGPSTIISLNLTIPAQKDDSSGLPIVAICEVAWCKAIDKTRRFLIGVKFLDILEDDFHALMRYIEGPKAPG